MRQAIVAASLYGSKTAFAKQCGALVCRLPVNLLSCSLLIAFAAVKVMRRGVIAGLKVHTSTPCCLVNVAPCSLAEQFCLAAFLTMSCCDLKQRKRGGLAVISPPPFLGFWSKKAHCEVCCKAGGASRRTRFHTHQATRYAGVYRQADSHTFVSFLC